MKIRVLLPIVLLASTAMARDQKFYQKGTLAEMNSVECGFDENSGKKFSGMVLGTDSANVKTKKMLCPEYVLKTDRVTYRIRPCEEKHPVLLPVGETAKFRMKKDRMVLRVPEGDDKERDYNVISALPNPDADGARAEAARPAKKGDKDPNQVLPKTPRKQRIHLAGGTSSSSDGRRPSLSTASALEAARAFPRGWCHRRTFLP